MQYGLYKYNEQLTIGERMFEKAIILGGTAMAIKGLMALLTIMGSTQEVVYQVLTK